MGRVIGFIGVRTSVGSTMLCYEMAKKLANKNFRVCVIDFYFSMNDISNMFFCEADFDLKDFLVGKIGVEGIVVSECDNLYYIKTNAVRFDYCYYKEDIKKLITMLAYKFDYILIDVNSFNSKILSLAINVINESFIIFDNEINSIRLLPRMTRILKSNNDLDVINYVFNKSKIIGQINKKFLKRIEIEELIGENILFEIPKFLKNNYSNKSNNVDYKNKIMDKFCNSLITNKTLHLNYSKRYKGFLGRLKKRLYARFE